MNDIRKCTGFEVKINCHTDDALEVLAHPEKVQEIVAEAIEKEVEKPDNRKGLQEEIDFTLEVKRIY